MLKSISLTMTFNGLPCNCFTLSNWSFGISMKSLSLRFCSLEIKAISLSRIHTFTYKCILKRCFACISTRSHHFVTFL